MKTDITKLKTISNYAIYKGLSRQHVYRLVQKNELTMVEIDGVSFILLDEKAVEFVRKRE